MTCSSQSANKRFRHVAGPDEGYVVGSHWYRVMVFLLRPYLPNSYSATAVTIYLVDPHAIIIRGVAAVHQVIALIVIRTRDKYLFPLFELGELTHPF
jgi:hypothetical protein